MTNAKFLPFVLLLLLAISLSCSFLKGKVSKTSSTDAPAIDFTTPGESLDVKVVLDKKQTASGSVGKNGGSVSMTGTDGSKFTLDVPAGALDTDTTITMTAVKTLDGAPLDTNTPNAVQFEPSGLFFNEMATLTVVPAKEIPLKKQVAFGYEGDGKDYHLMPLDPKSREIRIRLMTFSGVGVGSASDAAWAAGLAIQASEASTRIWQKWAEYAITERQAALEGNASQTTEYEDRMKAALDQFEDQVVFKESVAAELDCRLARTAIQHLLVLETNVKRRISQKGLSFRKNWLS